MVRIVLGTHCITNLGIFIELVRSDVIDREYQLDIILLCLFYKSRDLFRSRSVKKRAANLG